MYFSNEDLEISFLTLQERAQRYQRTAIDYSVLDGLGHGVKVVESNNRPYMTRASAVSSGNAGAHYPVFPNYEQLLPKANIGATVCIYFPIRESHQKIV